MAEARETLTDSETPPPRLDVILATVHAALFVAAGLAVNHLMNGVGGFVAGVERTTWVALLAWLWVTTWWTTRRWLTGVWSVPGESPPGGGWPDLDTTVVAAVIWGGLDAVLFVVALLGVTLGPQLLQAGPGALPIFPLAVVVGGLVAFSVGGVAGAVLAVLDVGCWRVLERLSDGD